MSNPIKNDGREQVPKIVKVKVRVSSVGTGDPSYDITLTVDEVVSIFGFTVELQFQSSGSYYLNPSSIHSITPVMPPPTPVDSDILYKVSTTHVFPTNESTITVVLSFPDQEITFDPDTNVPYTFEE